MRSSGAGCEYVGADTDPTHIVAQLGKLDELHATVECPWDGKLDADAVHLVAVRARETAARSISLSSGVALADFKAALRGRVKAVGWHQFGRDAGVFLCRAPSISFLCVRTLWPTHVFLHEGEGARRNGALKPDPAKKEKERKRPAPKGACRVCAVFASFCAGVEELAKSAPGGADNVRVQACRAGLMWVQAVDGADESARRAQALRREIRDFISAQSGDMSGPLFRKDATGVVRRSAGGAVLLDLQHLLVDPESFSAVCLLARGLA